MRGNEPELLKKIAGGDWSDETKQALDDAVEHLAEDFGYDLDEEGHPLEEERCARAAPPCGEPSGASTSRERGEGARSAEAQ